MPRHWRLGVPERIAADGEVLLPLDEAALRSAAARCGPRASRRSPSASCTASPIRRMSAAPARSSREELPGLAVSLSCEVAPEIREYERASTTIANAYVLPVMSATSAGWSRAARGGPRRAALLMMSARRHHHRRDRAALPGPPGGMRPGRRRASGARRRGGERHRPTPSPSTWAARRRSCLIDDGRPCSAPAVRGGARPSLPQGQRPADAHPGDRDGRDRRRRRLDRPARRARPHHRSGRTPPAPCRDRPATAAAARRRR